MVWGDIAPEKLLRTLLLQVLYTVRSERMLMEQFHLLVIHPYLSSSIERSPESGNIGARRRSLTLNLTAEAPAFHAAVRFRQRPWLTRPPTPKRLQSAQPTIPIHGSKEFRAEERRFLFVK